MVSGRQVPQSVHNAPAVSLSSLLRMSFVQVNQDKFNAAVCVGSCGLYRRAALEPFGGVAAIAHSEDMYTGYKMTELGYTVRVAVSCHPLLDIIKILSSEHYVYLCRGLS